MKKFHIVGAFDRHNYGDILFPLVHSKFIQSRLGENAIIDYFSVTESDLTKDGGVKTDTIKSLIQRGCHEKDVVIMSGGDILSVGWPLMMGHVSSGYIYFALRVVNKVFGFNIANNLTRKLYRQINEFPYVLSGKNINAKVYYSCVGGSGFNCKSSHLTRVVTELKLSEHVSVRDNKIQAVLQEEGLDCALVPDSALVMSDLFPISELGSRDWSLKIKSDNGFDLKNYIVFQAGKIFIADNIDIIIEQLNLIYKKTGMSILLLPIGRATGHEDHKVLELIYNRLSKNSCPVGIQTSAHVLDIMASLAFCQCYIGTSLHGAISAYSFGHKVCGFATAKVKKLKAFLATWVKINDCSIIENENFSSAFLDLISSGNSINNMESLKQQKEMIYTNLIRYI